MKLKSVHVQNFRCIRDQTLNCEDLTILVGPNGSGKSSFLRALDLFYSTSLSYTQDDFYDRDTDTPISITVTFSELDNGEMKRYQRYVHNSELSITRKLQWPPRRGSAKYHGRHKCNPDFDKFRSASGSNLQREYNALLQGMYKELPQYSNKNEAEDALREWEERNPDKCEDREDDGQFFGYAAVGKWVLEKGTRFILVPAVRDAALDAREGKGSPFSEIMDIVVRSALENAPNWQDLQNLVRNEYHKVIGPIRENKLEQIQSDLMEILQKYVPSGSVEIDWDVETEPEIPAPRATVRLAEDEFYSPAELCGHGLQRALSLAMLHLLAKIRARLGTDVTPNEPTLIIAIEEPEAYQHPNRQRHLARVFVDLAENGLPGVAERIQIICATHSPLFVDIANSHRVRKLRKIKNHDTLPPETIVVSTNLDTLARELEQIYDKNQGTFSNRSVLSRLIAVMTPQLNEGFFADAVVLVEGETDRAAILAVARRRGYDFEALGISVLPCSGKGSMIVPAIVFSSFEIPIYLVWDADTQPGASGQNDPHNKRLFRLMTGKANGSPGTITSSYACLQTNLEETIRSEIGNALFDRIVEQRSNDFGMRRNAVVKRATVIEDILKQAEQSERNCQTIENIVKQIVKLVER